MPRTIHEPTARKRKRAAALQVSEPSLRESLGAAPIALSHHGHGIAELAASLANLQDLSIVLVNAEGPAGRVCNEIAADADALKTEERSNACKPLQRLEDAGSRSHGMVSTLEQLILRLEPRTLSETLSLSLVLADEMEVFLCDHVDREDPKVDKERLRLGDALRAIVRGLVSAGAASPLVENYAHDNDLASWFEAHSTASRDAATYLLRKQEAAQ